MSSHLCSRNRHVHKTCTVSMRVHVTCYVTSLQRKQCNSTVIYNAYVVVAYITPLCD